MREQSSAVTAAQWRAPEPLARGPVAVLAARDITVTTRPNGRIEAREVPVNPARAATRPPAWQGKPTRGVKAVFDIAAAAVSLVLLAPLLLGVAALVWCTSKGPALFRQTRVGRDGRTFTMIKFRSMYRNSERELPQLLGHNDSEGGVLFKLREDPRVTPVGRVLRRLSLDELPQLLNVLGGSMSLVGPRPPLPREVLGYGARVRRRLLVKPGLTGLWQVSGRSDLSWEDSVTLDLRYVEDWSLALDSVVLCKTVGAVLRGEGAY